MTTFEIIAVVVLVASWVGSVLLDRQLKKALKKSEEQLTALQNELGRLEKNVDNLTEHLRVIYPMQHANKN